MKLKVRVTANDIRMGVREDANCCAVARAVKRLVNSDLRDSVEVAGSIDVDSQNCNVLKGDVSEWISKFDESKASVKPTTFIVDMPLYVIDEKVLAQVKF